MTLDQLRAPKTGDLVATIKTTMGDIKLRLFPNAAPLTVDNFVKLSEDGYYNGVIFHRVIPNFMVQGGDPTGTGRGGESIYGRPFDDEFDVDYRNFRGALSMANAGPDTNGSQFFIVQMDSVPEEGLAQMREVGADGGYHDDIVDTYKELGGAYWLDFRHTVFGQVYDGMDVVDSISTVERDPMDKPLTDVVINEIIIEEL